MTQPVVETVVRGVRLRLVAHTRALELCARMNRELEVLDYIDQMAPNDVLFDLGACEGRFSLYAALKGIRCYAFEPERMNFEALSQNIALNREGLSGHLTALNVAVGASKHRTAIRIAQTWAGGHQKVLADVPSRVDLQFDFVEEQPVDVVSLDGLIEDGTIDRPTWLKIDVDGSEGPVMDGARRTLGDGALKGVMIELHEGDASFRDVGDQLRERGFAMVDRYPVEPGLYNVLFTRTATSASTTD